MLLFHVVFSHCHMHSFGVFGAFNRIVEHVPVNHCPIHYKNINCFKMGIYIFLLFNNKIWCQSSIIPLKKAYII